MARYGLVTLVLLLSVGLGVSRANLLLNPGFEEWTGGQPDCWEVQGGITVSQESDTVHGGSYSARVDYPQGQSGSRWVRQTVSVTGGDDYQGSLWVYDNSDQVRSRIWISWRDGSNNHISGVGSPYSIDSQGWQDLSTDVVRAPDSAVTARFDLRVYDSDSLGGTLWFDDVHFWLAWGVEEHGELHPSASTLTLAAFPNPAASGMLVEFTLPGRSQADLAAYDLMGRKISTLFQGRRSGGYNSLWWVLPAEGMTSGCYFLRLRAHGQHKVERVVVIR